MKEKIIIDQWKIVMITTKDVEIELIDIPDSVTQPIDEIIESQYKVTWQR